MQVFSNNGKLLRDDRGRILREALEYSVVDHCNLRCGGCDHSAPHMKSRFADPTAFARDMEALTKYIHVRFLRLLGGEPLLHRELDAFVRTAREIGIADKVTLWTNGLLLHKVRRELLAAFDVVRVSLYPGIKVRANLTMLARDLKADGTRLEVVYVRKFMHQLLNHRMEDSRLVQRTYLRCKEAHSWSCHTVYDGRYFKCAKASLLHHRLTGYGVQVSNRAHDSVAIHNNPHLADDLERYLLSTQPLAACSWCLGTDGKSFRHHQLNEAGMLSERRYQAKSNSAPLANSMTRFLRDIRDFAKHNI